MHGHGGGDDGADGEAAAGAVVVDAGREDRCAGGDGGDHGPAVDAAWFGGIAAYVAEQAA